MRSGLLVRNTHSVSPGPYPHCGADHQPGAHRLFALSVVTIGTGQAIEGHPAHQLRQDAVSGAEANRLRQHLLDASTPGNPPGLAVSGARE
jgi:hypothetical protein